MTDIKTTINDLRAHRDRIDEAISALERVTDADSAEIAMRPLTPREKRHYTRIKPIVAGARVIRHPNVKYSDTPCGFPGCGRPLSMQNKTGFCTKHFYYGKKLKEQLGGTDADREKAKESKKRKLRIAAKERWVVAKKMGLTKLGPRA